MSLWDRFFYEGTVSEVCSIQSHLMALFNTKQGTVPYDKDYGLPDLIQCYSHLPQSSWQLQQCLLRLVERYEPRLRDCVCMPMNHSLVPQGLCFSLRGVLVVGNKELGLVASFLPEGDCLVSSVLQEG